MLILWKPKFHTQEILWILQCCGMMEVTTALECRREQWMHENLKGGGEVKVFYKGKSLSEAVTYSWCLLNADSLIKFAEDTILGRSWYAWRQGCCSEGPRQGPYQVQQGQIPVLSLGRRNCWQTYRLGPNWFESNSAEKNLWVLWWSPSWMWARFVPWYQAQPTASWTALIACNLRKW